MVQNRVSVIIPSYNAGRYIRHAIESVLEQSYEAYEVIVVDDGSTDGTAARVRDYAPRVRYVRRPHRGAAAARNHGASLARGEWLAFLDADDFWYPHRLSEQIKLARRHPELDYITGNFHCVEECGRLAGEGFQGNPLVGNNEEDDTPRPSVVLGPERGAAYVRHRFGILTTMLVRRDVFERVGGFDERFRLAEDLHLMFRLVAAGRSFGAVCTPIAAYRRRDGSTSHGALDVRNRETLRAFRDLLRHAALPPGMARAIRDQVVETQLDLAHLLARKHRRLAATLAAVRAVATRPSRRSLRAVASVQFAAREDRSAEEPAEIDPVELFRFGAIV